MTKRKLRFEENLRIREPALKAALQAHPSLEVEMVGRSPKPGCLLRVYLESHYRVLCNTRNKDRVFASLDAAGRHALALGLTTLKLDLSRYSAGPIRERQDRAEALRNLHAAISDPQGKAPKP